MGGHVGDQGDAGVCRPPGGRAVPCVFGEEGQRAEKRVHDVSGFCRVRLGFFGVVHVDAPVQGESDGGGAVAVQPRSASRGRTSPTARVGVERFTPNQQADTSCVTPCRRCTRVVRRRSTKTGRCFAPAPIARFRSLEASPGLVPFMPQQAQFSHEFSDHVGRQSGDPPVADDRRTRRVPHHATMIDDQELDASPPTVHEPVGNSSRK